MHSSVDIVILGMGGGGVSKLSGHVGANRSVADNVDH